MSATLQHEHSVTADLKVSQHRLDNGLIIVSLCDPNTEVISYQSWFQVGSRDERKGKTGIAHFFEHLMFTETESTALGEFDRLIESTGGDTNAATWTDWTYYTSSVPRSRLRQIAELEADRLIALTLTDPVVEAEREVVMNERLQRVDDDLDGFAREELFALAFSEHPYGWPTIGWMDDIKGLSRGDLNAFYRAHYAPDQLTLVVVGGFDQAELLEIVSSSYGHLPASGQTRRRLSPEPTQHSVRTASYNKETHAPRVHFGYHGPSQRESDWQATYLACQYLAGSSSSPLHRRLIVEEEIATDLYCDIYPFGEPSLVELSVTGKAGSTCEELRKIVDDELRLCLATEPTVDGVEAVKNFAESDFFGQLATSEGKADALGHYHSVTGDFRSLFSSIRTMQNAQPRDLHEAMTDIFASEVRTEINIHPEGENV